jgi:hypothetical protein
MEVFGYFSKYYSGHPPTDANRLWSQSSLPFDRGEIRSPSVWSFLSISGPMSLRFKLLSTLILSDSVGRMTIGSQSGACRCVSWRQCKPLTRRQNAEAQEDGVDLICFWLKKTKPFYARSPYDVASH